MFNFSRMSSLYLLSVRNAFMISLSDMRLLRNNSPLKMLLTYQNHKYFSIRQRVLL